MDRRDDKATDPERRRSLAGSGKPGGRLRGAGRTLREAGVDVHGARERDDSPADPAGG